MDFWQLFFPLCMGVCEIVEGVMLIRGSSAFKDKVFVVLNDEAKTNEFLHTSGTIDIACGAVIVAVALVFYFTGRDAIIPDALVLVWLVITMVFNYTKTGKPFIV